MYIARARCESQLTVGSSGLNARWSWGRAVEFKFFLAWSSIAQSVYQRAFSLLAIWCLGSRVQILLSADEHNLSPFDLNIACLCQSIEINNNKYELIAIPQAMFHDVSKSWRAFGIRTLYLPKPNPNYTDLSFCESWTPVPKAVFSFV